LLTRYNRQSGNTLDQFRAAAQNAGQSTMPPQVQGGVLGSSQASTSSSSTSPSSSSKNAGALLRPSDVLFLGAFIALAASFM
jgi:hypothetical protein